MEYVAGRAPREDIILVDACDRTGLSPTLSAPDLYSNLRRRLTVDGVLVVNMCGDETDVENHIARIRGVFGQRLIALPAREDGNLIVLGFRTAPRLWDGARAGRSRAQAGREVRTGVSALCPPDGVRVAPDVSGAA